MFGVIHNRNMFIIRFIRFLFNIVLYLLSGGQVFHTVWLEESEVQQGLEETHSFLGVTRLPQKMALLKEDLCQTKQHKLPVSVSLEFWERLDLFN